MPLSKSVNPKQNLTACMQNSNPLFAQTQPYWDFLRIEKQASPHT